MCWIQKPSSDNIFSSIIQHWRSFPFNSSLPRVWYCRIGWGFWSHSGGHEMQGKVCNYSSWRKNVILVDSTGFRMKTALMALLSWVTPQGGLLQFCVAATSRCLAEVVFIVASFYGSWLWSLLTSTLALTQKIKPAKTDYPQELDNATIRRFIRDDFFCNKNFDHNYYSPVSAFDTSYFTKMWNFQKTICGLFGLKFLMVSIALCVHIDSKVIRRRVWTSQRCTTFLLIQDHGYFIFEQN